jgi:hypothetical protein
MRLNPVVRSIGFLAICGLGGSLAFADTIQYTITVDTTSEFGNTGYIDMQFNEGPQNTELATAQVTSFTTDATLDTFGSDTYDGITGDVTGTLPGTLTFVNDDPTNEYTNGITFGTTISFNLDLSGPAIDSPGGSTTYPSGGGSFYLDFFDPSGNTLLSNSGNTTGGDALEVDINPDGSTTVTTFENGNTGISAVTVSGPTALTGIPEPSVVFLLAGCLAAVAGFRQRRRGRGL